jgi:hypothetical protein
MKKRKNKKKNRRCEQCRGTQHVIDFSTYNDGFWKGVEAAASFVEEWDSYINHEWRLSDCIRAKFNIPDFPKKKLRKNKRENVIVGVWH